MKKFEPHINNFVITFMITSLIAYHDFGVTSIHFNRYCNQQTHNIDKNYDSVMHVVNDGKICHSKVNAAFSNLYSKRLSIDIRNKKGNKGPFISETRYIRMQKNRNDMINYNDTAFQECFHLIVTDFKSASFKKQKSLVDFGNVHENKTNQRFAPTMIENQLKETLALSPSLFHLYCDFNNKNKDRDNKEHITNISNIEEGGNVQLPIAKMISLVGPYRKPKLLDMIMRHPELFSRCIASKKLKSRDYQLALTLELSEKDLEKLKTGSSSGLWHRLHRRDIIEFSNYFETCFCFTKNDVRKMVLSRPFILAYTMEKIQKSVEYLRFELDLEINDVSMMIKRNPMILACSPTQKIQPLVQFLRDDIGIHDWRRIITKNSQLFSYSIEKHLRPKTKFIYESLGLQRVSDLSFVVSGFPPVLWLSTELISNKLDYFKEEFQLDEEEIRGLFLTYPQLLGLSIDANIRPKVSYFLSSALDGGAGLNRQELKDLTLYQPAILAYSLEKRIKPRIKQMQDNFISFCYAPQYLMSLTDIKFNKWLEIQRGTWSITEKP